MIRAETVKIFILNYDLFPFYTPKEFSSYLKAKFEPLYNMLVYPTLMNNK